MKNILLPFALVSLLSACNESSKTDTSSTDSAKPPTATAAPDPRTAIAKLLALDSTALKDTLATNPPLFLKVASNHMQWEVPAKPEHLVGPIYFVGTQGLASYLITTPQGHILLYTGMPSSGPMIEQSIRKLGFKPEDIKYLITGHAHIDHVGAFAYMKKLSGAQVAIIDKEKELIESGGKTDFFYGAYPEFQFEPVHVDRVLHNGDVIKLGDILMKAIFTPGHTKGGTTWMTNVTDSGKTYNVVFPDGTSINPGYRVVVDPSYPEIQNNLRSTLHTLATLHPDIWFSSHTEFFNYRAKDSLAATKGAKAWVDPKGYKQRIANEKANFEMKIKAEEKAKRSGQ